MNRLRCIAGACFIAILVGCGVGHRTPAAPAGGNELSVQVSLPERVVSGKVIPLDLKFENTSSKQVCFTFGKFVVVSHSLASFDPMTITGNDPGGGGSEEELGCTVNDPKILSPGMRYTAHLELDPIPQAPGDGLLSVYLKVPVFGERCECEKRQFLSIEEQRKVRIFAQ